MWFMLTLWYRDEVVNNLNKHFRNKESIASWIKVSRWNILRLVYWEHVHGLEWEVLRRPQLVKSIRWGDRYVERFSYCYLRFRFLRYPSAYWNGCSRFQCSSRSKLNGWSPKLVQIDPVLPRPNATVGNKGCDLISLAAAPVWAPVSIGYLKINLCTNRNNDHCAWTRCSFGQDASHNQ